MRTSTIILCLLLLGGMLAAYAEDLPRAYVARNGVLTLYGDRELDDYSGRVETDEGLIVDEVVFLQGLHGYARIAEPQHLRGYVDTDELLELMAVWCDTLNLRAGPSLDDKVLSTLERGAVVTFLEPTIGCPVWEDDYSWRHCRVEDREGWLAEEYLIEKGRLDALEPALELCDAGNNLEMLTHLTVIGLRYGDVAVEIAPDGHTAAVAFDNPHWSGTRYTERLFLLAADAFEHMVYSGRIFDYCFSEGGVHTFVRYDYRRYGRGCSTEQPYLVLDNSTGEVVHMGRVYPYAFLDSEELIGRERCGVFIGDDHLLLLDHRWPNDLPADYPVIAKYVALPFVSLLEVSSGEKLILLEPDPEWLAEHGVDDGTIRLQRSAACDESRPLIERAVETELFRRCEEQYLPIIYSEA